MDLTSTNCNSISYSHSPNIFIEKYVESDGDTITIGSILAYNIIIKNLSDFDLDSAYLIDDIIKGLHYKKNSLFIDGLDTTLEKTDLNSKPVINLGTVKSNTIATIYFEVYIDKTPSTFPIMSSSKLIYSYYNNNELFFDVKYSNKIESFFTLPKLQNQIQQYVDDVEICNKSLSDEVQFKILISPKENLINAILKNYLNKDLIFVSAYLINKNNQLQNELILENKYIYIGNLSKEDTYEIVINAKLKNYLNEINNHIIVNNPVLEYSISDSNIHLNAQVKPVYLYINHANLESIVLTDKKQLAFDDELAITIRLKHMGTVPIENIIINNILPEDLYYINNSFIIIYNNSLEYNLHYDEDSNSIYIPYLNLQENIEVSIKAKVIPKDTSKVYRILNDIYLNYQFVKYPFDYKNKYEYISNEIINNKNYYENCDSKKICDIHCYECSDMDYSNDEYDEISNKFTMNRHSNKNTPNSHLHCNKCSPIYDDDCECNADLLSTLCKKVTSSCNCMCNKIDYQVSFTNTGELTAYNVLICDIISGAILQKNSLCIYTSNSSKPKEFCGELPKIKISEVLPNETITIYFSAIVDNCDKNEQVCNYVNLYYQYYINYCAQPINTHGRSNIVVTDVGNKIESTLTINESINVENLVDSESYFKIKIINTSSKDLFDVIYTLDLSDDYASYIKYKPNSLIISGKQPPTDINPNIMPIELGTIKAHESVIIEFIEISLKSTQSPIIFFANGIYSYENCNSEIIICSDITNEATLSLIGPTVSINKYAYSYCKNNVECTIKPITSAAIGERITYKITISNHGSYTLENLLLNDIISSNLSYVPGSLKINNKSVSFDLQNNLKLPDLQPNSNIIVSFDVIVESLPNPPVISNTACVTYDYLINPVKCIRERGKNCSTNNLDIIYANLTLGATKVSNPSVVSRIDPANNFGRYTVTLKNTGNIDALDIKFVDKLPNGLTFIPNSVAVTGVDEKGNTVPLIVNSIPPGGELNVENGIIISKIPPLITVYIKYGFNVNSDASSIIKNTGTFDYSYIANGVTVNKPNNYTSTDTIVVIDNVVDLSQIASPSSACLNDTILYTINVSNLSSNTLQNVILQSTIPANTTFVDGSFTVNLNPINPPVTVKQLAQGVNIGNISPKPNNTAIIQYQVKVNISATSPILNTVNVHYANITIPSKAYTTTSNVVVPSNCPTPLACKIVDVDKEAYSYCVPGDINCIPKLVTDASLGDRITYKIPVKNTSSVTITDAVFNDVLPMGTTFVKDSLKINGTTIPSGFIQDLPIGILEPNQSSLISFDVIVTSIPGTFNISNTSCITYSAVLCSGCDKQQETNCASYRFNIKSPNLNDSLKKYVDQVGTVENIKAPGSNIPYIVQFKNTGNSDALNVVFYDTIPSSSDYIANSVVVTPPIPKENIIEPTSSNPVLQIEFGNISPNQGYTINFDTKLKSSFVFGDVYNKSQLNYSYISASTGNTVLKNPVSNTVVTHVNAPKIDITKEESITIADIFEPVVYTITVKNTGNLMANNVLVTDTLSPYLRYIPDTLKINGQPSDQNINVGVLLGTIQPNRTVTIEFQIEAVETPISNSIKNIAQAIYSYILDPITEEVIQGSATSNTVSLDIIAANLLHFPPQKDVSTRVVSHDDPASSTGNYIITLYNAGNTDALNVVVRDILPDGMTFIPNSVTVVGTALPGNTVPLVVESIPPGGPLNIVNGIKIKSIPPTITVKTTFGFQINSLTPITLSNTSYIDYEYFSGTNFIVKPGNPTNPTTIVARTSALDISKTVYPGTICPGDTTLYTVSLKNLVTNTLSNVILQDSLPIQVSLVPNSFIINNKPFTIGNKPVTGSDLATGVNIGSIPIGDSKLIQFLATTTLSRSTNSIVNTANVNYTNGTIPSKVYTSTAVAVISKDCSKPCCPPYDCNCSNNCPIYCSPNHNHPCPHYGKSSCKPGKRTLCRKFYSQY